ncbi:MAG: hypothetical protein CSA21_02510 [Deltaproteobacteria bacterium]|nr:MAG: hypothetical protein CSA21_02510 [Deltaproteobacteria bacterium]
MYIALTRTDQGIRYDLKHSVRHKHTWVARTILNLQDDPGQYIVYPGGNAFYIADEVQDAVLQQQSEFDYDELEDLFWPFVREDIRIKIGHIRGRASSWRGPKQLHYEQEQRVLNEIHPFDKRRLLYLKCGGIDLSRINQAPLKIFYPLLSMSRDEREQRFLWMEHDLDQDEYRNYVYASLNLQRFFTKPTARLLPQTVDQDDLDAAFMNAICDLNQDRLFWQGFPTRPGLQEYLIRFAVMFFDYAFCHESPWERQAQAFINSHRIHRQPPPPSPPVPAEEMQELFGLPKEQLLNLSRKEVTRIFRKQAMTHHPDRGGDTETFIRLFTAYETLLRKPGC